MTFAGFPPTIEKGGTLFTTTLPAATIDPRPMVTPFVMMQLLPTQTLSSSVVGWDTGGLYPMPW